MRLPCCCRFHRPILCYNLTLPQRGWFTMLEENVRPLWGRLGNLALPLFFAGVLLTIFYSEWITTPRPEPGPVHITYWEKWTGFESDAMRDVVNAYNASQKRIHVDMLTIS